jgi:CheY-like chemotaxis protein
VPARIPSDDVLQQLSGRRVLIVDDNATNREIVIRQTRSWGMEPVAAEGPLEALVLIDGGQEFDVAVLDQMMPEMDGLTLAREIRRRRDERELPLVLLTSLGRLQEVRAAGEFAAQLVKPLKASQLYNALLSVLAERGQAPATVAAAVQDGGPARSSLRILLAEDNSLNQKVALALLDRLGYRADVVWNGFEVLEALERHPYDVVRMDVQMPELDGLDASRRIRERWPQATRPRIIAMTANAMLEDREACFAAGMDDYVAKPIRPEALAEALGHARLRAGEGLKLEAGALESLRELGGNEFLAEVVDTFRLDAPGLLVTLRRSLEQSDADELRRAAHTLKSNGATLSAVGFAELCGELEEHARNRDLKVAPELTERIEAEYTRLEEALAALRAAAPKNDNGMF